jgi:hypothetical protein
MVQNICLSWQCSVRLCNTIGRQSAARPGLQVPLIQSGIWHVNTNLSVLKCPHCGEKYYLKGFLKLYFALSFTIGWYDWIASMRNGTPSKA